VGLNKGFITTKLAEKSQHERISHRKGRANNRVSQVRRIIREVSGFAPYEKRITEMLRAGTAKETKKAMKLAKKRLGTFTRAKAKREFLLGVIAEQRKKKEARDEN
jgi:large subunit ribosomal protein L36e